ncbi:hypothetical protein GJU39_20825 [Pedobacter petrophilus]|uniref:DUF4142 domain-containing protein n=1 Tax=Pedobacter petrophilus TaxID=1908241 RepID=A0A7K0G6A9_9SPHI|nr:hypothetical protein [Pedobacter petrophilus]MRX78526.1 hypothetical protein [Pedobacter petrophilus]
MVYQIMHLFQRHPITLLLLGMLLSACHKEDPTGYDMPVSTFAEVVVRKNVYQIALAQEMELLQHDDNLFTLAAKRKRQSEEFIREISNATSTPENVNNLTLHEEDKSRIMELRTLPGADYREGLITLLMDADQELIALHVKASSSTGVADESIRNWAAGKLPLLKENLNEVQQIK